MKQADIETAFANKLKAFGDVAFKSVKWPFTDEDRQETPKNDGPYMRGTCVMGKPYNASLSGRSRVFSRQEGFYQVTLHYPRTKNSPGDMRDFADAVIEQFWDQGPSIVSHNGSEADCHRKPGFTRLPPDGVFIRCAITIWFRTED